MDARKSLADSPLDLAPIKILYVDEETEVRWMLVRGFVNFPYVDLRLASGGRSALTFVGSFRPDVLVIDLNLPDLSGIEVVRRIQRTPAFAGLPMVLVSGGTTEEQSEELKKSGLGVDLEKPFSFTDFVRAVERVLHRHIVPA